MRAWPVVLALALPAALAGCPQFLSDWKVAAGSADGSSPEEASVDSSTDAVIGVVDSGSLLDAVDSSSIDSTAIVGDSGSADAVLDTDTDSPALQEAGADSTIGGQDGGPAVCVFALVNRLPVGNGGRRDGGARCQIATAG